MDGNSLQDRAAARTEELPGAELMHPFGPDWDVWKVRGKVFMLQAVLADEALVTLKAEPEESRALREAYADITPGYHMNKKHWITVHPDGALDEQLLEDLVTDSYVAFRSLSATTTPDTSTSSATVPDGWHWSGPS